MDFTKKFMKQSSVAFTNFSTQGVDEWTKHLALTNPPPLDFTDEGMKTYKLGDWKLQNGEVIKDAFLAYKTYGDEGLPVILYPTWYSGLISSNEWLIGTNRVLNPEKYHIIIPALFGNGQSSSPSNSTQTPFPFITFYDNVLAQHSLLTSHLKITHVLAVLGWSMGAGQTYQWTTQFPTFMDLAIPFCGSARTSLHNQVFLEGVKAALLAGKGISSAGICAGGVGEKKGGLMGGRGTWSVEQRERGLKALGRVYAGWGFSQAFYRQNLYHTYLGYKDLEDFMREFWEKWALSKDPENMLTMLYTWQSGDVSKQEPYNGDFKAAMKGIKCKVLVVPCKTDLYFPPEDSAIEVEHMNPGVGELKQFDSIWGHWAGGPGDCKEDGEWFDGALRELGL